MSEILLIAGAVSFLFYFVSAPESFSATPEHFMNADEVANPHLGVRSRLCIRSSDKRPDIYRLILGMFTGRTNSAHKLS